MVTNQFTWSEKSAEGVPPSAYMGVFNGVNPVPPNPEKEWGPGLEFLWTIDVGPQSGKTTHRIVSIPKGPPGPKNNLGKMLMALKGDKPAEGESLDPAQWVGKRYTIIVAQAPNGGTRVETVAPIAG